MTAPNDDAMKTVKPATVSGKPSARKAPTSPDNQRRKA
jgi:hypothetical protein